MFIKDNILPSDPSPRFSKMAKLRRENWKGKFFIVVRDDKGKILSRKKWSKKSTLGESKTKFNKDKTLVENVSLTKFSRVKQVTDFRKSPSRKGLSWQYIVYARMDDGKIIKGMSQSFQSNQVTMSEARDEAYDNLYKRVHVVYKNPFESDPDKGKDIFEDKTGRVIKEGTVRYVLL